MSDKHEFQVDDKFLPAKDKDKCSNCRKELTKEDNEFANYFEDYGNNTSIHGIKYVGDRKRTITEKVLWAFILIFALTYCSYMIYKTYNKWKSNPVIISFDEKPTYIWEIPFPAITICPELKFDQREFNYTDLYMKNEVGNITEKELELYSLLSLVCTNERYTNGSETVSNDIYEFLNSLTPRVVTPTVSYNNKRYEMEDLFELQLTEEGLCYTFNTLNSTKIYKTEGNFYLDSEFDDNSSLEWLLEDGYVNDNPNAYPRRPRGVGYKSGLRVELYYNEEYFDYLCGDGMQGFKVILHQPAEYAKSTIDYYRVPLDQEVIVGITPDMTITTDDLMSYNPKDRNCYFSDEKPLTYFQNYTLKNCEMECLTKHTLRHCGCVEFYMPHNDSTPICGSGKINCMEEVETNLTNTFFMSEEMDCDCLPACISLNYKKELSQSKLNSEKLLQNYEIEDDDISKYRIAATTIYFKESQFYAVQRSELYGSIDFIANIGGIFGLFTGFSILSFMEIIYYITMRPCVNKVKHGKWHRNEPAETP